MNNQLYVLTFWIDQDTFDSEPEEEEDEDELVDSREGGAICLAGEEEDEEEEDEDAPRTTGDTLIADIHDAIGTVIDVIQIDELDQDPGTFIRVQVTHEEMAFIVREGILPMLSSISSSDIELISVEISRVEQSSYLPVMKQKVAATPARITATVHPSPSQPKKQLELML